ncbi:MAG TPA: poly-gamma-glutamate hydrolase family protein [Methylocystis sp.]|nr:poly-gamma-glutamate hydrolase family protein [Methylocystis sp.]
MADRYSCFAELAAQERAGVDYRVRVVSRSSPVAIVAPHGGRIEPGTSEIADLLAGRDFSLYCFESLGCGKNLHITSSRFDEPQALALVGAAEIVATVHGRADGGDAAAIWLGGLHAPFRDALAARLERAGFATSTDHHMQGRHPENICNKGRLRAGVQIELPRSMRNAFRSDAERRGAFVAACRAAIAEAAGALGPGPSAQAMTCGTTTLRFAIRPPRSR